MGFVRILIGRHEPVYQRYQAYASENAASIAAAAVRSGMTVASPSEASGISSMKEI